MVAMTAGMVVAMGAMLMARNASAFFQSEARLSNAQFASMVGMARLQNDVRRAGMGSTPNAMLDPWVCGYQATWPGTQTQGMRPLSGVQIIQNGSTIAHGNDLQLSTQNNLNPDALIVAGEMTSTEHFSVQALVPAGGGAYNVFIQADGAYWRTVLNGQGGVQAFNNIFIVGGFVRMVDQDGRSTFGVVSGVNVGGPVPVVSVAGTPPLATKATNGVCGCSGVCVGNIINPISIVRYDLRKVDPVTYPQYAGMFSDANINGNVPPQFKGEVQPARTELTRVELDANGAEIATTLEVLAEYAVDFKFGLTCADSGSPATNYVPTMRRYPIGSNNVYTVGQTILNSGHPEHASVLTVRLSTRAQSADRMIGLPPTPDGGLYRFNLDPTNNGNVQSWARMRTLVTDIYLNNQAGVPWQAGYTCPQ